MHHVNFYEYFIFSDDDSNTRDRRFRRDEGGLNQVTLDTQTKLAWSQASGQLEKN